MSQFINTVKDVGKNYSKYDKWEQARADKIAQKEALVRRGAFSENKLELTQKKAQTVIRATEIMDTRSENNCENVEQVVGMVAGLPALGLFFAQNPIIKFINKYLNKNSKELKNLKETLAKTTDVSAEKEIQNKIIKILNKNATKANNIGVFGTMGLIFATGIGMILWGNSQQKQASRIGRFQAKQDELKDLENFIVYTPEQIAEAEKIAKTIPDKKERNSLSQAFYELKEMQRDRGAYKKWAKQKDPKELEKLKSRNISQEDLLKAKEDKELITNTVAEINIKAEEFSENLENAFDTFGTLSWLAAVPIGLGVNSLLSKFTQMNSEKRKLASSVVGFLTGLSISLVGTFEQKNASRIGRYHARQDLINNPHKLMSFTDSEIAEVQDIKASKQKKGFFEKISDSFIFLKNYYKQKKEYKNYKENIQKYNEKMQEAFKQIETTDVQKAEAKALQTNVFRAFDEVDEMSQCYSEDIEASTEIAKSTLNSIWEIGAILGTTFLGVGIAKGKISLAKPIKKLSDMTFVKESSLKKSIDNLYEVFSQKGSKSVKEFQKELLSGNLKKYLEKAENAEIKVALDKLKQEFKQTGIEGLANKTFESSEKDAPALIEKIFESHFKQTWLAKWARSITIQSSKLWLRKQMNRNLENKISTAAKGKKPFSAEEIKELYAQNRKQQELFGLNNTYKNYKTLYNTSIALAAPFLATIFTVPYMFNAWLTDIQKKAGKIGVMKAMNNLDDPRIFANTNS